MAAQDTPDAAERRARALLDGATPGPWTHERVGYGQHAVTPDARSEIFVEREGDAALMAAAPDLARNVIDLAVGVVIGAAFGKIVTALVEKIIMPPLGMLIGKVDFSQLAWTLSPASIGADGKEIPAVVIGYGDFINTLIQFVIVAFAIFLVVKTINRLSRKQEAAPAAPAEEVVLLREIRDSLKK